MQLLYKVFVNGCREVNVELYRNMSGIDAELVGISLLSNDRHYMSSGCPHRPFGAWASDHSEPLVCPLKVSL